MASLRSRVVLAMGGKNVPLYSPSSCDSNRLIIAADVACCGKGGQELRVLYGHLNSSVHEMKVQCRSSIPIARPKQTYANKLLLEFSCFGCLRCPMSHQQDSDAAHCCLSQGPLLLVRI